LTLRGVLLTAINNNHINRKLRALFGVQVSRNREMIGNVVFVVELREERTLSFTTVSITPTVNVYTRGPADQQDRPPVVLHRLQGVQRNGVVNLLGRVSIYGVGLASLSVGRISQHNVN
jgi:hypothetical protein